jgi:hypothetical protein
MDLENLNRDIKKLTNDTINVRNNISEGTYNQIYFKPFFRKYTIQKPQKIPPPPKNLNHDLKGISMEILYTYHQKNHSKKTCP